MFNKCTRRSIEYLWKLVQYIAEEKRNSLHILKENNITHSNIASYFYFSNFAMIMDIANIQAFSCLGLFYYQNIRNYYIKQNQDNYIKKIDRIAKFANKNFRNADFAGFLLEDFTIYGRTINYDDVFYLNFMKSSLLGVLYELQNSIKNCLRNNSPFSLLNSSRSDFIDKIKLHKDKEIIIKIIAQIIENPEITVDKLAEKTYNTTDTIKNKFRTIVSLDNKKSGQLGAVKQIIKDYNITASDF